MKVTPNLTFEIDRVFEQATRVEELLAEIAKEPPVGAESDEDGDEDEDEDEDGKEGRA
jgi:hypothetical protein